MAAVEGKESLHRLTAVPLPFQGRLMCKLANTVQNKVNRLHKQHLKKPALRLQAKATTGVGKPQADSEYNERIPPDGFDMAALEVAQKCFFYNSLP